MKTIADLNNTWWYRLVKILYCGVFLIGGIAIAMHVYSTYKTTQVHDVGVTCDYGNKSSFNLLTDKGIAIDTYSDYKGVPADLNKQILQACQITPADITTAKEKAVAETIKMQHGHDCVNDSDSLYCSFGYSDATYRIGGDRVPVSTPWKGIGYAAITLFAFLCLFEIIRRLFYYVATGKFRPR